MSSNTDGFRKNVLAPMRDGFPPVNYATYRVCDEGRRILGWLERDLPVFEARNLPITRGDVETLELCLRVLAEEGADRAESALDARSYKKLVAKEQKAFAAYKAQVILWAKASPLDWRMFNLRMGKGSVPRFLDAADLFVELLERHERALVDPPRIAEIRAGVVGIVDRVRAARIARGLDDAEGKQGTLATRQALRVMYDVLTRVSHIGQALFYEDTPHREGYRLSLQARERPERPRAGEEATPTQEPEGTDAVGGDGPAAIPGAPRVPAGVDE